MDLLSLLALFLTLASASQLHEDAAPSLHKDAAQSPAAQPPQYCRLGLTTGSADFCLAITQYHNHSSSAHDLYLRLSIRRPSPSAHLGWTAIAIGHRMQDALMFIVYGDPSTTPPILSVRTTTQGHSAPIPISSESIPITPRIIDATWSSSANSTTADLSAIIYSYSRWPAIARFATTSPSLPWLWAWHPSQDLSPYLPSSPLTHHDLSTTGFGSFYVDMRSASTHHAPAMPTLHPSLTNIHTSEMPLPPDSPLHSLTSRPLLTLHALLMATAFLLLFPLGALAIRSRSPSAFRTHWSLQAGATSTALIAALTGMSMSDWALLGSPHQIAGTTISFCLLLQVLLGWRHHVDFLRIRRRTAISYAHIILGFAILVAGWLNLLSGIVLAESRRGLLFAVACVVFLEALAVTAWAVIARRRRADAAKESPESSAAYFALDDLHSEDEGEEEGLIKG